MILQHISTHTFFYVNERVGTHSSQPSRKPSFRALSITLYKPRALHCRVPEPDPAPVGSWPTV